MPAASCPSRPSDASTGPRSWSTGAPSGRAAGRPWRRSSTPRSNPNPNPNPDPDPNPNPSPSPSPNPNQEKLDIISAFQAYGQFVTGQINDEERPTLSLTLSPDLSPKRQPQPQPHPQPSPQPHPHPQPNPNQERLSLVESSCPGPGACGGMYTANTMASAIEALGLSVLLRVP